MTKPILAIIIGLAILSCKPNDIKETPPVKFITLDPGHFHAALVQKTGYATIDSNLYVFAPKGAEVDDFLSKIEQYNTREENPTNWNVTSYFGEDYLDKMVEQKPGQVMVVAGKNSKKIDYILAAVKAGINVYADKPLVINAEGYKKLEEAFKIAKDNNVMIYDIMTERFEITTALQKQLSLIPELIGKPIDGSIEEPTISKESVHHFSKIVSGKPLIRPAWFFDINEEGEGIVDVTTHLVDLVQWELFPDEIINKEDIEILEAKRWPTVLNKAQFLKVTGLNEYPAYLSSKNDEISVYCNGEITYKIKGKIAKVSVIWNFEAPAGTGDTHFSTLRGSKGSLSIKQGKEEDYKPTLYLTDSDLTIDQVSTFLKDKIEPNYKGISAEKIDETTFKINIPDALKIGHEAHFGQVTENFLSYLEKNELPNWEVPNMLTKYYITTEALKKAQ